MEIDIFQLPGILKKRAHYIVLSVIACVVLAFLYLSTLVPTYRSSTDILLDPQGLAERRDLIVAGSSPQEQSSLESQIYIVQSRDVLNEVIDKLSLEQDPFLVKAAKFSNNATPEMRKDAILGALVKRLKVERAGQSFIMTISAEHADPEKSALIANTIAQTYLSKISDTRVEANRRAGESFQSQAGELRERVLKAELAVEDFKAENGLTTTGEQGGLLINQQVSGISEQLTAARVAEEQQKANFDQARNLTVAAIEAGAIPEAAQSQSIELLRSRYTQLLEREAELAAALGTNHPQMRAVRSQLAGVRQSINSEISRLRESMRASYERAAANTKAISDQLNKLTKSSFDKGEALTRMRQLESEADAVRTIYKTFLGKAEELGQSQSVNNNNSHVISVAVPPSAPPGGIKKIVLAAAAMFGVALGSVLAVLREILGGNGGGARANLLRAGLPIIASFPVETKAGGKAGRMGAWMGMGRASKRTGRRDDHRRREIGMLRIAHLLLNHFGGRQMPAAIIFVAPGEDSDEGLVVEVAELLASLGQNVAYAPGQLSRAARQNTRPVRAVRGMLATRQDLDEDEDHFLLLGDRLVYERLSGETAPSRYGQRLMPPADIVLINACGTAACEFLPTLLESGDAIVPIANLDLADRNDADDMLYTLDPFREKVPGMVIIGKDV